MTAKHKARIAAAIIQADIRAVHATALPTRWFWMLSREKTARASPPSIAASVKVARMDKTIVIAIAEIRACIYDRGSRTLYKVFSASWMAETPTEADQMDAIRP